MAEFQEVMRQLNRMCLHYQNCGDSGCPLFDECGNIGSHSSNAKQAMRIEKVVMSWAAEHPEPPKEQKKRIKDHVCNNDYCELE